MILLDTSFLIDYFRGVEATRDIVKDQEVSTTVITYHEISTGLKSAKAKREEIFFRGFFSSIPIFEYDLRAAEESSEIAARLLASGKEVNALDILIVGIAVANGIEKIATRDKDFLEIEKVTDIEIITYQK
ncbi:tRNA(fMet)-specific endonuclease VapC [Candidatus Calditenuaceae archaeon HR02]|nr:tRNA(fMet)-specific endonuclease VapC [Candidatus Calditenuaceae archaeon HR02]